MCDYVSVSKGRENVAVEATQQRKGEREATYDAVVVADAPPPPTGRVLWAGELASCPVGDSGIVASPGSWLTSDVMATAAIFGMDSDR